jgi:hypothetical protein
LSFGASILADISNRALEMGLGLGLGMVLEFSFANENLLSVEDTTYLLGLVSNSSLSPRN